MFKANALNVMMFEDAIDIALMNATGLHEVLEQMQEDIDDGVFENDFQDAEEECNDDDLTIDYDGEPYGEETPIYSMSSADMDADTYIEVYSDMTSGAYMDIGDMIDAIAAQ